MVCGAISDVDQEIILAVSSIGIVHFCIDIFYAETESIDWFMVIRVCDLVAEMILCSSQTSLSSSDIYMKYTLYTYL